MDPRTSPLFSSGNNANLGSLGIAPMIPIPNIPNIVAEWAAIVPLVCHLATVRDDYITTGEIALLGRVSVGLFPKLGTLSGLARLMDRGTKFLDGASTRGGSSRTVWDVKWGSLFLCANGAAGAAITRHFLRDKCAPRRMPERLAREGPRKGQDTKVTDLKSWGSSSTSTSATSSLPPTAVAKPPASNSSSRETAIRRFQVLHVYQLHKRKRPVSLRQRIHRIHLSWMFRAFYLLALVALAILCCLIGAYGTASILFCGAATHVVAWTITIRRPNGYLRNNEPQDACMLVASHNNAMEWHLFTGDRAIVDTLLNKPMFEVPTGRTAAIATAWFRLAHLLQLAAMTFVAAQKGWDGVILVVLVLAHWLMHVLFREWTLAQHWMEREEVDASVRSFEFGGRVAMMGAIQAFSETNITSWMDEILVPHPRRDALLARIRDEDHQQSFTPWDATWIDNIAEASLAAAAVMKEEMRQARQKV